MGRIIIALALMGFFGSVQMQSDLLGNSAPNQSGLSSLLNNLPNLLPGNLGGQPQMNGQQQFQPNGLSDMLRNLPQGTMRLVQSLINQLRTTLSSANNQQFGRMNPMGSMMNQANRMGQMGQMGQMMPNQMGNPGDAVSGLMNSLGSTLSQTGLPLNGLTGNLQRSVSDISQQLTRSLNYAG